MTDFQRIDNSSDERMYGPRAALVCGATAEQQRQVIGVLADVEGARCVIASEDDRTATIGDLLARENESGLGSETTMPRLVLLSGLTQAEFHGVMRAYRQAGLPRPLWASLTPYSEGWTLGQLLDELEEERRAFEQKQP